MKTERINVRVTTDEKERLDKVADAAGLPAAHIVRVAVTAKINELEQKIQAETDLPVLLNPALAE